MLRASAELAGPGAEHKALSAAREFTLSPTQTSRFSETISCRGMCVGLIQLDGGGRLGALHLSYPPDMEASALSTRGPVSIAGPLQLPLNTKNAMGWMAHAMRGECDAPWDWRTDCAPGLRGTRQP